MDGGYGITSPAPHAHSAQQQPVRYLVLIDAAGASIARLFLETREQVGEFDAATEEVTQMTRGLVAARGALDALWDGPLAGHTAAERALAEVYTLPV
jgi:hypothetical protein